MDKHPTDFKEIINTHIKLIVPKLIALFVFYTNNYKNQPLLVSKGRNKGK